MIKDSFYEMSVFLLLVILAWNVFCAIGYYVIGKFLSEEQVLSRWVRIGLLIPLMLFGGLGVSLVALMSDIPGETADFRIARRIGRHLTVMMTISVVMFIIGLFIQTFGFNIVIFIIVISIITAELSTPTVRVTKGPFFTFTK